MTDPQTIVTAATMLPEPDRVRVIEALLDSLTPEPDDPESVANAWREEVVRRSNELREGVAQPIPWSQVRAEGERLLNGGD